MDWPETLQLHSWRRFSSGDVGRLGSQHKVSPGERVNEWGEIIILLFHSNARYCPGEGPSLSLLHSSETNAGLPTSTLIHYHPSILMSSGHPSIIAIFWLTSPEAIASRDSSLFTSSKSNNNTSSLQKHLHLQKEQAGDLNY